MEESSVETVKRVKKEVATVPIRKFDPVEVEEFLPSWTWRRAERRKEAGNKVPWKGWLFERNIGDKKCRIAIEQSQPLESVTLYIGPTTRKFEGAHKVKMDHQAGVLSFLFRGHIWDEKQRIVGTGGQYRISKEGLVHSVTTKGEVLEHHDLRGSQ